MNFVVMDAVFSLSDELLGQSVGVTEMRFLSDGSDGWGDR
jgi:hypothetical protein